MTLLRKGSFAAFGLGALSALAFACANIEDGSESSISDLASSQDLVISQVYTAGGNAQAKYKQDYVELFNKSKSAVSLQGMTFHYTSKEFKADQAIDLPEDAKVEPGKYFLIALKDPPPPANGGTARELHGEDLPVAADLTLELNMGAAKGKVAIVAADKELDGCGDTTDCSAELWVDYVGYGEGSRAETAPVEGLSTKKAAFRKDAGCSDTGNNQADFEAAEALPRNSKSPAVESCDEAAEDAGPGPSVDASTGKDGGGMTVRDASAPVDAGVRDSGGGSEPYDAATPPRPSKPVRDARADDEDDDDDYDTDLGDNSDEIEPPSKPEKKKSGATTPPKLAKKDADCSMSPGPARSGGVIAVAGIAIAIASLGRRRRR